MMLSVWMFICRTGLTSPYAGGSTLSYISSDIRGSYYHNVDQTDRISYSGHTSNDVNGKTSILEDVTSCLSWADIASLFCPCSVMIRMSNLLLVTSLKKGRRMLFPPKLNKFIWRPLRLIIMSVWNPRKTVFTFFSGLSTSCHWLLLICCSSSNLAVTSSMESCKRSQNPARSWDVGLGMALGSCRGGGWVGEEKEGFFMMISHFCQVQDY